MLFTFQVDLQLSTGKITIRRLRAHYSNCKDTYWNHSKHSSDCTTTH